MSELIEWFSADPWQHLTFTLLHSLWVGLVFAFLLWAALKRVSSRRPRLRYAISLLALLGVVVGALIVRGVLGVGDGEPSDPAASRMPSQSPAQAQSEKNIAGSSPQAQSNPAPQAFDPTTEKEGGLTGSSIWIPWAALGWLIGSSIMVLRLACQLAAVHRASRLGKPISDRTVLGILDDLRLNMRIGRPVRCLTSEAYTTPAVFGVIWPTLLLPGSLATGMSPIQLRAILAHELAHIKRHDYLINIVQSLFEALLFFNPAVWWISRQIRNEREACCDALAAELSGTEADYAEALTNWVGRDRRPSTATASMAMPGRASGSGAVLDRIKRLFLPDYRPPLLLPWYSFIASLFAALLLLAGLYHGTQATVAVAAELLSPSERIKKMAHIEQSHDSNDQAHVQADSITVSGTLRTEDGMPPPEGTLLGISVESERSSHTLYGVAMNEGEFHYEKDPGTVFLWANAPGFAPVMLGPLQPDADGTLTLGEVTLSRGFNSTIKLVAPDGSPIPGVELKGSYQHSPAAPNNTLELTTNDEGIATVQHVAEHPILFEIRRSGYGYDERDQVLLKPDTMTQWTIKPAEPTTGRVLSKKTGEPIADAQVSLLQRKGRYPRNAPTDPTEAPPLTRTDSNGSFVLDTLTDRAIHRLYVHASGYGSEILDNVRPGDEDLRVELGPKRTLKGKVTGALDKLRRRRDKAVIHVKTTLRLHERNTSSYTRAHPVTIKDGVGHFEVAASYPPEWATMEIQAGDLTNRVDIASLPKKIEIHLEPESKSEETASQETRPVVFRFETDDLMPPPQGRLNVRHPPSRQHDRPFSSLRINDGEAYLEIPVPGRLSYNPDALVGYWFDKERHHKVPTGDKPHVINVPVIAAGSISGKLEHPETAPENIFVTVLEVEKAAGKRRPGLLGVDADVRPGGWSTGRFALQPLPLGGKYFIVLRRNGLNFTTSDVVSLTETNPIREITLQLKQGKPLIGTVTDAEGIPVANASLSLSYETPYNHSFGTTDNKHTGPDGRFTFKQINPDVPGRYVIQIRGVVDHRPYKGIVELNEPAPFSTRIRLKPGHVVKGKVIDAETGKPISGIEVEAEPEHEQPGTEPFPYLEAEAPTNEDGEFRFSNLRQADYTLNVEGAEVVSTDEKQQARGGQPDPVIIKVKRSSQKTQ